MKGRRRGSVADLGIENVKSSFEKEELDAYKLMFDTYDKDSSGVISQSEMVHLLRDMGEEASEEELKYTLNQCDFNNDGSMSFDEFLTVK
jgi:Ca2+-binding EF-hand superfamily protein